MPNFAPKRLALAAVCAVAFVMSGQLIAAGTSQTWWTLDVAIVACYLVALVGIRVVSGPRSFLRWAATGCAMAIVAFIAWLGVR